MPVLRAHLVNGRVLVKFNSDQARDDHGRWTGGGGNIGSQDEALGGLWRDTVLRTGEVSRQSPGVASGALDPALVPSWVTDLDVRGAAKDQAVQAVTAQPAMQALTTDQMTAAMVGYDESEQTVQAVTPWDGNTDNGPYVVAMTNGNLEVQQAQDVVDLGMTPETTVSPDKSTEENLAAVQKALANADIAGGWVLSGTPQATEMLRQTVSNDLISSWAATSNDASWRALGVQQAAADQLGITDYQPMSETQASRLANPNADGMGDVTTEQVNAATPAFKAFVQSEYDATQADLAANGITSVTLYRGDRNGYAEDATSVTLRPLSSWSTDPFTADRFSSPKDGQDVSRIVQMTVPASAIVATPRTGAGCLREYEFVVKGGTYPVTVGTAGGGTTTGFSPEGGLAKAASGSTWHEDTDEKTDWIKTLSWDLPTDPDVFLRAIGGRRALTHFLTLPAAEAMPQALASSLGVAIPHRLDKAFNPDQARDDHGRWTSGGPGSNLAFDPTRYPIDSTDFQRVISDIGWHGGVANPANVKANADLNANGACAKAGIQVDWGSVDPRLAQAYDQRVADLHAAYPDVKIAYVGTHSPGETEQATWGKIDPGTGAYTESVTATDTLTAAGINLETGEGGDNVTDEQISAFEQQSIHDPAGYRIVVNPRTDSNLDLSATLSTYSRKMNYTTEMDPPAALTHEFGHAVAMTHGWIPGDMESVDALTLRSAMDQPEFDRAPNYARTTPQETIAESWTAMHQSSRPPAWAKEVWDVVYKPVYGDKPATLFKPVVKASADASQVSTPGVDALGQPYAKAVTPDLSKFSPDQARDDHGRWTSGGVSQMTDQATAAAYASAVQNDEDAAKGKSVADYSKGIEISPEKQAENHRVNQNLVKGTDAQVLREGLFAPKIIDYGVTDPATAQRINRELSTLQSQYPEVSLGKVVAGNLNPGVYAETNDGSGKTSQTITFNQGMMDAPGELRTRLSQDESSGFHPPNCDKPEFIAAHEYGHALANSLPRPVVSSIANLGLQELDAGYVSHTNVSGLSRYAQTNVKEFVAEAFGDYTINGANSLPVSQIVGADMQRAYNSRHGKAATADLSKFNPDQARDDKGRWTTDGGISSGEARDIVHDAIAGGFSYNPSTHAHPTDGYMVARSGATVQVAAGSPEEAQKGLVDFIDQNHAQFAADPSLYIGGWVEDGKLWIEPSDNILDHDKAFAVSAKRDQIAMFDVKALDVINTGGSGGDRADPAWNVHPDLVPYGKAALVPAPAGRVAADVAKREGGVGGRGAGAPVPGRVRDWPGWGADERLVAHFAPRLAHAIQGNLNVDALCQAVAITKAASPEFSHFLDTARQTVAAYAGDPQGVQVLAELYGQSYVLGTHSATQVADQMGWPAAQVYPASDAILRSPGLSTLLSQAGITIKSVAANRLDRLATVLAQGMVDGKPPREIAKDLRPIMADQSWAETVARTETARAQTAGALNEYGRLGVNRVEFLTAQDDRECPLCLENEDAGARDVSDPAAWPEGDPPVHPNCRCAIAPVPFTDASDAAGAAEDVNAPTVDQAETDAEETSAIAEASGFLRAVDEPAESAPQAEFIQHHDHRIDYHPEQTQQIQSENQDSSLTEVNQGVEDSADYISHDLSGFDQNVTSAGPVTFPATPPGVVPVNTPNPGSTTPKPSSQNGQNRRPRRPKPPKRG
jgi:SPP1 gp7 family putative phage head morphogenesis protein